MQSTSIEAGSTQATTEGEAAGKAAEQPQTRERERSGILGEPASVPPGDEGHSDGSERGDPIHEQVPNDGKDHWRR